MNIPINKKYNFWEDDPLLTNPVITLSGFYTKIDYTLPLFRTRIHKGFDIYDKKELQYPEKKNCKKLGRANIPFHPVFYASYSKECAIKEIRLKENLNVVITEWRWKPDISLSVKLFSKLETAFEQSLIKFNIRTVKEYVDLSERIRGPITPDSMHGKMLEKMHTLCDLFLNDEDYFGSALVAYEELYRSRLSKTVQSSDLLVYPSVFNDGGVNVAVHPEVVDKYLEIYSVELIDVAEDGKFQLKSSHRWQR
jgi:hypothetical protein